MAKRNVSDFEHIKRLWLKRHKRIQRQLIIKHKGSLSELEKHSKHIVAGSLGGLLILSHPTNATLLNQVSTRPQPNEEIVTNERQRRQQFLDELSKQLPKQIEPVPEDVERKVVETLIKYFDLPVRAELEGKRLNRTYGLIGAEQHLMRYSGDTMASHFSTPAENRFHSSGMAPGRGAWGYFSPSRSEITQKDIDREKYYIAVQTFLSKGYMENVREFASFFKYRKVLVVNPENGKAMVVVVGDAGPGKSTGKHLGGSPEVMDYLERQDGRAKGPVLYFFLDDPDDTIPLGPTAIK